MHNPHTLKIDFTGANAYAVALTQDTLYSKNYGAICAVIPENSEHGFRPCTFPIILFICIISPRPEAAGRPTKPFLSGETLETVKHLKHLLSQKRHYPLRQPLMGTVIAHTNNGLVAIDAKGEGD